MTIGSFLARLFGRPRAEQHVWIEAPALKERMDRSEEVILVDVRGAAEFGGPLGHIPGARNIDVAELPRRMGELDAFKDQAVTLVCLTDRRSAAAARVLMAAGFSDVSVLRGGVTQWRQHDFAVE